MNNGAPAGQEEAAFVTAEFVNGLDNLPNEVHHILAEIKHKETKSLEIQQDIQKDTTRYIRRALKSSAPKDSKENGKEKDIKERDALIPDRVAVAYKELDQLALEKIALGKRLVETMTRVSARLDHDLAKVMTLSGEPTQEHYEVRGGYVVGTLPNPSGAPITLSANATAARPTAIDKVVESLRAAEIPVSASTATTQTSQKRARSGRAISHQSDLPNPTSRRTNTVTSATTSSRAHTPQARTRQTHQARPSPSRGRRPPSSLGDEDAEGEEDADADADADDQESGDPEDKELYCYCQKMSYGEMIACDNDDCPFQWFHLDCVGLKQPLPEHWYCDDCLRSLGAGGGPGRKRARKA